MKQALLLIAVFAMMAAGLAVFMDGLLDHIDAVEDRTANYLEGSR